MAKKTKSDFRCLCFFSVINVFAYFGKQAVLNRIQAYVKYNEMNRSDINGEVFGQLKYLYRTLM